MRGFVLYSMKITTVSRVSVQQHSAIEDREKKRNEIKVSKPKWWKSMIFSLSLKSTNKKREQITI